MLKKIWRETYPVIGFVVAIAVVVTGGLYWAAKNSGWV